ncbi:MAG: RNA polymerase sigma factor [Bacteroidales bacterium]|jgi:RNA polymerase sigma-70 factor (ECF subfamily)|nr:RNA polymerase sigma factor [Bacteroidales bacterium]
MMDLPVQDKFVSEINPHQKIIYKICYLYTNNSTDFNDLYQEIILQLWKSYSKFEGKSKLSTWIYRVSLNTALYRLRQEKNRLQIDLLSQLHYDIPEIEDFEKKESVERVKELLGNLSDIEKAIITLYLDEYSHDEISEIMGITKTNIATRINRIKLKLKQKFNN